MNIINRDLVNQRIENGYEFKFSEYLTKGFELLKKDMGIFILSFLVMMLTSWVPVIGISIQTNFFTICHKVENGEKADIGDLFHFDNLLQLFIFFLIIIIAAGLIMIPFMIYIGTIGSQLESSSDMPDSMGIMMGVFILLFVVIIFLLAALLYFAIPLIHFGEYQALDAIKTSFLLAKKNILMLLLFFFVVTILGSLGTIFCYIGLLVSMPFYYCALYHSYKDILFPKNTIENSINEIRGI